MKKLALIMLSIVLVMSYAQKIEAQISPTQWASQVLNAPFSYTFPDSALIVIDSALSVLYPNDTLEGGKRNNFNKFHQFISTRFPAQISNQDIGGTYAKALHIAQATTSTCGNSITNKGNWINFGPENDPSYQNQGMVKDVWIDPNDEEHIRVGTEQGGLFEKKANTNWINITDNASQLGNMGINSFAVHPTDPLKMWVTTLIPAAEVGGHIIQNSMWNYAMGIYYTDDGGNTWTKELTYPASITQYFDPELVYGCKIKYAPYQVNGEDFVILTIRDHILSKLGAAPWVDMTPSGLTGWTPNTFTISEELSDIEFLTETQNHGTFVISTVYDDYKSNTATGVWRVDFDMTTGNIINPPIQLFTHDLNGFTINGLVISSLTITGEIICYNIEYMGNGNFYMVAQYDFNDNNQINYKDADFSTWNISNVNSTGLIQSRTVLLSNLFGLLGANPRFINKFECDPINPHVGYLGTNFAGPSAFILYNQNNQWQIKSLNDQNEFHKDIRCIHINQSSANSLGYNDIVYWGNDGGLTKTSLHDISTTSNAANFIAENLNGPGLYISDLTDADHSEDGKSVVGAAFHDGWYAFDRVNNIWNGEIDGDGFNAKIDDRFASSTNSRMIYQSPFRNYSYIDNPVSSTAGVGINMPEGPGLSWRTSPMQFTGPLMYIGIRRGWQSDPWGYSSSTWTGLHINANLLQTYIDELIKPISYSPALEVSVKNPKRAYHMLHGRKLDWRLAKGDFNSNTLKWDWQDITHPIVATTDQYGQVYTYTDLVIDPNSVTGDRLFVSLGELPWNFASTNRVMVSGDAGATFTDKSTGLPPLPVNCLAYQEGSNDIIYAGTDAGVYYWDINLGCWVKMNNGMPNCIVSRLDIDYCRRKLIAATYGRGFWESDLIQPSIFPDVTDVIPTGTPVVWTGDKHIKGSILVPANATLKIFGAFPNGGWTSSTNIYMPKYGRIYVEKGGRLEVDQARITSECDWWYGIHAYGSNAPQIINSQGYDPSHGIIKLSKAIIEHAEEAVNNFGGDDAPNTGGIIQSDGSYFLNNYRSAAFLKYLNKQGSVLLKDLSYFNEDLFEINSSMRQTFHAHISMWGVRGIRIRDCGFSNTQNLDQSHERGLYTIDASYDISNSNTSFQKSIFERFYTAIESADFSWEKVSLWPPSIVNTLFDRNEIGIYYNTSSLFTINNNELRIGVKQTPYPSGTGWQYYSLGSKLENTTNFSYCNNIHELIPNSKPAAASFQYTAGTEVYNTGDNDQQIENNTYTGLLIGNDAAYQCASANGLMGLNYRFNTNTDNTRFDFIMQANTQIRKNQYAQLTSGNNYRATSNVFTQVPITSTMINWYNTPGNNIVNYYHGSATNQIPNANSVNLNKFQVSVGTAFSCGLAQLAEGKEEELTASEFNTLKEEYAEEEVIYNGLLNAYMTLIDAGNTEGTIDYITLSNSQEATQVRDEMLNRSPYVSLEVLIALAKRDILPQPYLLEILVANPDATQSDALLDTLENYIPTPLPGYMLNMIKNSWTGSTLRSQLEAGLSHHHDELTAKRNTILGIYGTSPQFYQDDSTLVWMQKLPSIRNRYHLIEYLLYNGQYEDAETYLESLPTDFKMTQFDLTEYSAYQTLYDFKKNLLMDSLEINQLDSSRKAQLINIADATEYSFARSMARNALCFFYAICYPDTVRVLPGSSNKQTPKNKFILPKDVVTVYPNPAQNHVSFQFKLSAGNEAKELQVFDVTGKQVYIADLSKTQLLHVWDTRLVQNGTYIYKVKDSGGEQYTGKVTISK